MFLLKSQLHPRIPKTAPRRPFCQPDLAPSAAWRSPQFCPPHSGSMEEANPFCHPFLDQPRGHPPPPHSHCQPDPATSAVERAPKSPICSLLLPQLQVQTGQVYPLHYTHTYPKPNLSPYSWILTTFQSHRRNQSANKEASPRSQNSPLMPPRRSQPVLSPPPHPSLKTFIAPPSLPSTLIPHVPQHQAKAIRAD